MLQGISKGSGQDLKQVKNGKLTVLKNVALLEMEEGRKNSGRGINSIGEQ